MLTFFRLPQPLRSSARSAQQAIRFAARHWTDRIRRLRLMKQLQVIHELDHRTPCRANHCSSRILIRPAMRAASCPGDVSADAGRRASLVSVLRGSYDYQLGSVALCLPKCLAWIPATGRVQRCPLMRDHRIWYPLSIRYVETLRDESLPGCEGYPYTQCGHPLRRLIPATMAENRCGVPISVIHSDLSYALGSEHSRAHVARWYPSRPPHSRGRGWL